MEIVDGKHGIENQVAAQREGPQKMECDISFPLHHMGFLPRIQVYFERGLYAWFK